MHKTNYFGSEKDLQSDEAFLREINEFRFSPMTINECKYNMLLCSLFVPSAVISVAIRDRRGRRTVSCPLQNGTGPGSPVAPAPPLLHPLS